MRENGARFEQYQVQLMNITMLASAGASAARFSGDPDNLQRRKSSAGKDRRRRAQHSLVPRSTWKALGWRRVNDLAAPSANDIDFGGGDQGKPSPFGRAPGILKLPRNDNKK